ncbi:MAG: 1-deoxy-D-xylulose-5-phosphate reductoisomerase [Bacillota bacterium]|jgi:1-deoxy-D-xylulose-5-phosphate reductoisomerase
MKNIAVLGSTGSIGRQTLDIVRWFPHKFRVSTLAARSNYKLLAEQAAEFKPDVVALFDECHYQDLKKLLAVTDFRGEVLVGDAGIDLAASYDDVNIVVAGISGLAGLKPVIKGIEAGKDIAFANKEVLVAAGSLVMNLVKEKGVRLLPVDSEHSALWQCMQGHNGIDSLVLTCSGGPFKYMSKKELLKVTKDDALKHPTWSMGPKITVDSATLMNKGLEIIEAHWLFNVDYDKIQVVIHPESIVHSMVQYKDSAVLAHMGYPDMRVPIQYALTYPERLENPLKKLDFAALKQITFAEPDLERFPALGLAMAAGREGGSLPIVLNGANEVLVWRFLRDEISFYDISDGVEAVLSKHHRIENPDFEEILAIDAWSRRSAAEF